jgi:hypothetical protein
VVEGEAHCERLLYHGYQIEVSVEHRVEVELREERHVAVGKSDVPAALRWSQERASAMLLREATRRAANYGDCARETHTENSPACTQDETR